VICQNLVIVGVASFFVEGGFPLTVVTDDAPPLVSPASGGNLVASVHKHRVRESGRGRINNFTAHTHVWYRVYFGARFVNWNIKDFIN